MFKKKNKKMNPAQLEAIRTKDFFDCILPGSVRFMSDHYIVGDSYRSVWVVREYPPSTEEQAILSQLADRGGVTLRIYHRLVEPMEQRKIMQNATRKNKLMSGGNDVNETIEAQGNLQDVVELLANLRKNKEPLLHCSVFIELKARTPDKLKELQSEISMELTRSKISVDRLTLRQKEGFLSVLPVGANQFGAQYERVLSASSVANLYPFNFSGKTDPHGLYIGRDKYGSNVLVDFDRRAEDKTTSNILILGNSGQGKSYLLKLILTNIRESGKTCICLDPESEYEELTRALGGCYIDFMSGEYTINPLEPKAWTDGSGEVDVTTPDAFKRVTRLSQHIAFLKDFFRAYKDFSDAQIDTIEILLMKLYARFGITDSTDYATKKPCDFPIMSDFYKLCQEEFHTYDRERKYLYTEEMLQEVCLGIHSMCVGAESKYFNGHTNIVDDKFLCFGVKGLMDTNKRLKDAMLVILLALSACSQEQSSSSNTQGDTSEVQSNQTVSEASNKAADSIPESEVFSTSDESASTRKILIAYFTAAENSGEGVDAVTTASYSTINGTAVGRLRAIADMIAEHTGSELFSIQTSVIYPTDGGELIDYAAQEQAEDARPELVSHIENLDDYDVIFVGYPNWRADMPQVLYSFFDKYDFTGKTIVPFNVHNGSRLSRTVQTIQELEPGAEVVEDAFTISEHDVENAAGEVDSWLDGLGY